jgi:NADH dehydrogenase
MTKHKIVIVGGGFGGIKAGLMLSKNPKFEVTLVTNQPDFRYYPTLYETATGKSRAIADIPLSEIFSKSPINIIIDTVTKLDRKNQHVITSSNKRIDFNALIIAIGVKTNYFNIKGLDEYSYGIKSIGEAEKFKEHLHEQITTDKKPDLNYVVIGGGPTGVELAAMLPSYISKILKQHHIKGRELHIDIIEASDRLLPRATKDLSKRVEKHLRKMGINVYTNTVVQSESSGKLMVNNKPIKSHTVVWTAGVANNSFFIDNKFKLSKNGRVIVDSRLQAEPGIYVIGDNADTPYSGMAQTAIYDAEFVSSNLIRLAKHQKAHKYKPKKPIYVFNVGPHWSAVLWGPFKIYGWLGTWFKEAALAAGYHDYEPWQMTIRKMSKNFIEDNKCPICDN